uniref:Uncharacterized protein n=1 Tax=Ciona savignyi TaxID=51511 RepID=H2ZDY8_CIOSA
PLADFVPCDEVPSIDLSAWIDCCSDCADSGSFETLSGHIRSQSRSKRSARKPHNHRRRNDRHNGTAADSTETPLALHQPPVNDPPPAHVGVEKLTNIETERVPVGSVDKLMSVIGRLESKIAELQGKVQTLEQKLDNRG